jgi:hypothetical protein
MLPRIQAGVEKTIANLKEAIGFELDPAMVPTLGPRWKPNVTNKWVTVEPEVMPDVYELSSDERAQMAHLIDGQHVGLHHDLHAGSCDRVLLSDLLIERSLKWGSRSYGMRSGNIVQYCATFDTTKEHDWYWNLDEDLPLDPTPCVIWRYGYSENAGGQTLQLVTRQIEQGVDLVAAGQVWEPYYLGDRSARAIVVHDYLSRNAGSNLTWGRASFAFSFFSSHHPVLTNRVFVDQWEQDHARGCLLIQGRPRAHVAGGCFLGGVQEQPLVKIEGEGELCFFEKNIVHARGGQAWIDVAPGWEKVWIAGCKGEAHVKREGKDLGPARDVQGWL